MASFKRNLELFAKTNPKAAIYLQDVEPSTVSSLPTDDWFDKLELSNKDAIVLFGLGKGEAYLSAKKWLKSSSEKQLIFLEDRLDVIGSFLNSSLAKDLLTDPQAHLYHFSNIDEKDPIFSLIAWNFIQKQMMVTATPYYLQERSSEAELVKQLVLYSCAEKNEIVDEYLKYGIVFYRSFYRNLLLLHKSFHGNSLFGKFPKVPAIICGAGPSLKKNIHLLRELNNQALIFAGGSALNALCSQGITPHFGAGIDPNPTQYYRMMGHTAKGIPFFYRPRMHYEAFKTIHGPRLYINGAGGYDTAEWIEKKLDIDGDVIDEGHNVVNFCTEIAKEMGCDPIIFIGMDLAYTDLQAYAEGVVDDPNVTEEEIVQRAEFETAAIPREDIYGKNVFTMWKWIAESDWLSKFALENSQISIINSTEGGIGFTGVPNTPFSEVVQNILVNKYTLQEMIQKAISEASMPQVTEEKVLDVIMELKESLIACQKHLIILQEETKKIIQLLEGGKEPQTMQSGTAALAEVELSEEEAYGAVLDMFNTMYAMSINREVQNALQQDDPLCKELMLQKITEEKYLFLSRVVEANLLLLKEALL